MDQKKSVKRNISLPADLYDQIVAQAEREGRNFSNMVARLCSLEIEQENKHLSEKPAIYEIRKTGNGDG